MSRRDLLVEIQENELPRDKNRHYKKFYDSNVRTSGGFVDACFLGAAMLICFMWGMLLVILR